MLCIKIYNARRVKCFRKKFEAKPGDLILLISGAWQKALTILGTLRLEMAQSLNLIPVEKWNFLWVIDFPLLEYRRRKTICAVHHPFTAPKPEDVPLLENNPGKARARAYNLVVQWERNCRRQYSYTYTRSAK